VVLPVDDTCIDGPITGDNVVFHQQQE